MASSLSKEDREKYEKYIQEHEPYPEDAPEMNTFDGEGDPERSMATLLKMLLEGKIK